MGSRPSPGSLSSGLSDTDLLPDTFAPATGRRGDNCPPARRSGQIAGLGGYLAHPRTQTNLYRAAATDDRVAQQPTPGSAPGNQNHARPVGKRSTPEETSAGTPAKPTPALQGHRRELPRNRSGSVGTLASGGYYSHGHGAGPGGRRIGLGHIAFRGGSQ